MSEIQQHAHGHDFLSAGYHNIKLSPFWRGSEQVPAGGQRDRGEE